MKKDNSKQTWASDTYQQHTGFVSELGQGVLEWLAPQPGERILDLGCGDGILTRKIQDAGANVKGIDASESFVATCQEAGLDVSVGDGHALDFNGEFDAVFSNAALHWMLQPEKVIEGASKSLKPGGRFVAEFGGFGNIAAISTAMHAVGKAMGGDISTAGPWFFPTVEQYASMLQAGGFKVDRITTFYRPTPLPNGMKSWLQVMRAPFFEQFKDRADEAYSDVETFLRPSLCDHNGQWYADYVRLRFEATYPG